MNTKSVRKTKTLKKTALIALLAVFLISAVAGGVSFAADAEETAEVLPEAAEQAEQPAEETPGNASEDAAEPPLDAEKQPDAPSDDIHEESALTEEEAASEAELSSVLEEETVSGSETGKGEETQEPEPQEPEPEPTISIEKIEQVKIEENGDVTVTGLDETDKWSNDPVYFRIVVETTIPQSLLTVTEPEDGENSGNQSFKEGNPEIGFTLNDTNKPSDKLLIELEDESHPENPDTEDNNYIYSHTYIYKLTPKANVLVNSPLYVEAIHKINIPTKPEYNLETKQESSSSLMFDTQIPSLTLIDVGRVQGGKTEWNIKGFNQSADSLKIQVKLTTPEKGAEETSAYIVVNGVKAELEKQEGADSYIATIPFEELELKDGEELKITEFGYANEAGFEYSTETTPAENIPLDTGVYYCQDPIDVINLKFATSNSGSNGSAKLCREGDKLTLTFFANHPTDVKYGGREGCVMIAGQVVPCEKTQEGAKSFYKAEYQIPEGGLSKVSDDTAVPYSFTLTDGAGNSVTKTQEDTPKIVYYAPLSKVISGLNFVSDNANDKRLVKAGNTLTLSFKTNHPVTVENVSISGALGGKGAVSVKSSGGGLSHTITYVMPVGSVPDNTDIEFSLDIKDNAGNELNKTQEDLAKIRYYAPIEIHDLKMISNNEKTPETVAKDGNIITLTFSTTHPVTPTLCEIAGKPREITSEDGMHWTAVYSVSGSSDSLPDTEVIKMKLALEDAAGNDKIETDENGTLSEPVRYYAPIVVSDIDVQTSNTNGSARYAKDGDRMTVRFTTNHETEISDARIGGRTANQSVSEDGIARRHTMDITVPNGVVSDLSHIGWNFTASDIAGNEEVRVDQSQAKNQIQYFRPITSTATVRSDNQAQGYAKNGDTVTVSVTANHPVSLTSGNVGARSAGDGGGNSAALTYAYTIPAGETSLAEGELPVSYAVRDVAGNTLNVNGTADGSKIIYDRTAPEIDIKPLFNGFTNNSVTYTVIYSDDNLDPARVSLTQNGLQQISPSDISGNTYTKEVTLSDEDRYELSFTAADRAGNSVENAAEFIVTIDRTAPEIVITSAELKLDQAKTFPGGFVISEYFGIEEIPDHLETIDCTLTDASGQKAWDINEPIMQEGKTSMLLTASDKAGNTSAPLIYEFYIDATCPRPIIRDELTGRTLSQGENAAFIEQAEFAINLEALEMGDETPDVITEMLLLNEDGEVVNDVLTSGAAGENLYRLSLPDLGLYKLKISARDSVGNALEEAVYEINIAPKPWYQAFFDNKPLFYSVLIGAAAAVVLSALFIRAKRLKAQ